MYSVVFFFLSSEVAYEVVCGMCGLEVCVMFLCEQMWVFVCFFLSVGGRVCICVTVSWFL